MSDNEVFTSGHKQLQALNHSAAFTRLGRRDKLDELAILCSQLLGVVRVSFWRLTEGQLVLELEALYDRQRGLSHGPVSILAADHPAYFKALASERIVDAEDAPRDPRTRSMAASYLIPEQIASLLDAPVFGRGDIGGVVCLESRRSRRWSLADIALTCAIADSVSLINAHEDWQRSQQELDYIAHFDDLTGLSNYRALQKRLVTLTRPPEPSQDGRFVLVWVNIDKLKTINEGLGQNTGDDVIVAVAAKLRQMPVPGKDKIARVGGNEFAVIVRPSQRVELDFAVELLVKQLLEPLSLSQHTMHITLSAGIACAPEDGLEPTTLCRHAESAMYQAKDSGRHCARFFNLEASEKVRARFLLERELRHTIERQQLDVFYQPIFNAHLELVALEALVRWQHPERGWLSPAQFLPLAQSAGLMPDIDQVVLQRVCHDIRQSKDAGQPLPQVAINLSDDQIRRPDLAEQVAKLLSQYHIEGDQLEFEVTEEVMRDDSTRLQRSLQALVNLGSKLAIDDFGTGYSSLSRLKHLPFSKLKIDRSFISDLPEDEDDCAITRSVIGLAAGLKMTVVAEGVETDSHVSWLQAEGADYMQGFHFSRPLPLAELTERFLAPPGQSNRAGGD